MKIEIRKESFKIKSPLIRFENQKKVYLVTVKKVIKEDRVFVR